MFHLKFKPMENIKKSEILLVKVKYTFSFENRIIITVHDLDDFYISRFFDKLTKKRYSCRIMKSYYHDSQKLIPFLMNIINTEFNISC